jgi:transaldolase
MTKIHELAELGQAIWLDYIQRTLITSGELQGLVEQGLRGMTSNPTIFEKAIAGSQDYDSELRKLALEGKTVKEIYEALAIADIRGAADILRPVYEQTRGKDGYVSLEVSPKLAHDTHGTMVEAERLFNAVDRPNLMIKIPATEAGLPAIEETIARGINVNVTLIFAMEQYEKVAKAFMSGLEKLDARGGDLAKVASVASFFVSRIDSAVDKELTARGVTELQGKIAVASAKLAYEHFKRLFSSKRWQKLSAMGASVQRPLWASTSTKNPAYPDVLYVDNLIGPDTVNTLPPVALEAFLDHGKAALTLEEDLEQAHAQVRRLADLGISLEAVTRKLLEEGLAAFEKSFDDLMKSIAEKQSGFLKEASQNQQGKATL